MFFCAHLIYIVKYSEQQKFPMWENVHLIEAEDADIAEEIATKMGAENEEILSQDFICNGRPARMVFCGLRKLVPIWDDSLVSGTELTHLELEIDDEALVQKLLERKPVKLIYDEPCIAE